jgi:hypothetical protein
MLFLSIIITFLVGFSFVTACSSKFSFLEKTGSAFLLGIGIQVLWMLLFDFIAVPISILSVYSGSLFSIVLCWFYTLKLKKTDIKTAIWPYNPFAGKAWSRVNFPWLALMFFILYAVWAINVKCLFWPTFEFDSVAGYDLVAKVVAAEGSFNNSLFMSNGVSMYNMSLRAVYPPLVSGSFAYVYMSGAEVSKIMTSLYYWSYLLLLYGLLRRGGLTHLGTAFASLLMIYMPEMVSHAALSQTNMPQAVYTSCGLLALFIWMTDRKKNSHFLFLSMFILSLNSMIRSENIIFSFVAGIAVLFYTLKDRSKKNITNLITFGTVVLLPFLLWTLFLKINGMKPAAPGNGLAMSFVFDAAKLKEWWGYLWGGTNYKDGIVMNEFFYGLIPFLYMLFLPLVVAFGLFRIFRTKDNEQKILVKKIFNKDLALLYISLTPFVLYSLLYYFIDYNWDSMKNVILFSYKRGLFGIMTLFACFVCLSEPVKMSFDAIGRFMYGVKN